MAAFPSKPIALLAAWARTFDFTTHVPVDFCCELTLPQVAEYTTRIRQFGAIADAAELIPEATAADDIFALIEALRALSVAYADLATGPTTLVLGVSGPEAGFPGQSEVFAPPVITFFGSTLSGQSQLIQAASTLFDILSGDDLDFGDHPEKLYKSILADIADHGVMSTRANKGPFKEVFKDKSVDMTTAGALLYRLLNQMNDRFAVAYTVLDRGVEDIEGEGGILIGIAGQMIADTMTSFREAMMEILSKNNEEFDGPLRIPADSERSFTPGRSLITLFEELKSNMSG